MKAFCSFSGGKDSALSLFLAEKEGVDCEVLVTMLDERGGRTRSHGIRASLLSEQAFAIGKRMVQRSTSWEDYEKVFKDVVYSLKEEGIEAGIFGDIDIEEHRIWIERVCRELSIAPILPLWGMKREDIVKEFVDYSFKAFLCATRLEALRPYLGKEIDIEFLREMGSISVDPCGEKGEFHTFVYDGPIFKKRLLVEKGEEICKDGFYFLDVRLLEG